MLSGRSDSAAHPTTRCLERAGRGFSVGPCLVIKADCRELVKEGSAHRHNAGHAAAPRAEAEFAPQLAALGRAAGLGLG